MVSNTNVESMIVNWLHSCSEFDFVTESPHLKFLSERFSANFVVIQPGIRLAHLSTKRLRYVHKLFIVTSACYYAGWTSLFITNLRNISILRGVAPPSYITIRSSIEVRFSQAHRPHVIVVLNGVLQFDQCHIVVMICNPVIFGMCDDLLNCRILFKSVHCVKVMFTLKIRINVSIWATANLPLPFTQKQSTDSNLALMLG